nr:COX aromatic rich motif-containing protein [Altericroceibacterium indicum]
MEILIWGVPVIIVGVLAYSLWGTVHQIDPYRRLDKAGPAPIEVQVVALDWKFLFIYPNEHVASVNELVIPAGREVAFTITSDGPMMSFMVPRLGGQIYAMAGMKTQMHLSADQTGDYRGLNTQFNGTHFPEQSFVLKARNEAGYRAWLTKARAHPVLDSADYARLAKPATVASPLYFGGISDGLFDEIINKYHHGGHMAGAGF